MISDKCELVLMLIAALTDVIDTHASINVLALSLVRSKNPLNLK